jgi:hypothetical protein
MAKEETQELDKEPKLIRWCWRLPTPEGIEDWQWYRKVMAEGLKGKGYIYVAYNDFNEADPCFYGYALSTQEIPLGAKVIETEVNDKILIPHQEAVGATIERVEEADEADYTTLYLSNGITVGGYNLDFELR